MLARAQMRDNGKTLKECRAQAASAADTFRYYAAVCETFDGEFNTQRGASITASVYEPVGVVAAVTPWNSPLTLEAQKLAPILAAGNTPVLKPSEITPQVALGYAEIAIDAGLPPGVMNVVTGDAEVGRALVNHDGIDMISFTGGRLTGRAIAEAAARRLQAVVLELGGKSPNIIFADADLDRAAKTAADGIFSGGGQSCIAGISAFSVERTVFNEILSRLAMHAECCKLGAPECASTQMGPMVSFAHRDQVAAAVERACSEGGRVVVGGKRPVDQHLQAGAYHPATLITDVPNSARVCQEEIFGPVAVVLPFTNEADLIQQANASEFGLAAGIWTRDYARAWRSLDHCALAPSGSTRYKELSISVPFGGFKQSGVGREKGRQGMRAYMESKGIYWHVRPDSGRSPGTFC